MKPKPFSALNHFTVPCAIGNLFLLCVLLVPTGHGDTAAMKPPTDRDMPGRSGPGAVLRRSTAVRPTRGTAYNAPHRSSLGAVSHPRRRGGMMVTAVRWSTGPGRVRTVA